jgi:hypothetical protein
MTISTATSIGGDPVPVAPRLTQAERRYDGAANSVDAASALLETIELGHAEPAYVFTALAERLRDDARSAGHIMCLHTADALAVAIIRLGNGP